MSPEYRAALLSGRRRMGGLERETARDILRSITDWADNITRWLANRPNDPRRTQLAEAREVAYRMATEMAGRLRRATLTGRQVAFTDTLSTWQRATLLVAERRHIPNALLGAVRAPPMPILALHGNRPGAHTWQTALDRYAGNAAQEVDAVVRRALLDGVSPPELAQRLRRYVVGSDSFQQAFRRVQTVGGETWRIDLRQIPPEARGEAKRMRQNSERIAFTEMHNARFDAEHQAFIRDPLIAAVRWTLSNDRGSQEPPAPPDGCDIMAATDWYGLGAGVFPLDAVPSLIHPLDRCDLEPVERPVSEAGNPKPQQLERRPGMTVPRADTLTANARARAQASVSEALSLADESATQARQALREALPAGQRLAGMVRP